MNLSVAPLLVGVNEAIAVERPSEEKKPVLAQAIAAAAMMYFNTSNTGPLPDFGGGKYEHGTRLGLCKKDGEVFTDSRGKKYVYKNGTIRKA